MLLQERVRRIRETVEKKQEEVALLMDTTQQAYSSFEKSADNAKIGTLRKFCKATGIDFTFLFSDIPVTTESISKYGKTNFVELVAEKEKFENKANVLEELLTK